MSKSRDQYKINQNPHTYGSIGSTINQPKTAASSKANANAAISVFATQSNIGKKPKINIKKSNGLMPRGNTIDSRYAPQPNTQ